MNFGEKLKQIRTEKNLTQPQLADAIGIEQSYLSKLENDKSVPSAEVFQAILSGLKMDAKEVLSDIDKNILHGSMRQIPEVVNFINQTIATKVHDAKKWLFYSAAACVIGLSLITAGHLGLVFSRFSYSYFSDGIVKPGESEDIFKTYEEQFGRQLSANLISENEYRKALYDFTTQRKIVHNLVLEKDEGPLIRRNVEGGYRVYFRLILREFDNPRNKFLILIGAIFGFSGLFGFVLEYRLRRLSKQ
jgi:transcriptional regulator with XRE-family HTH domain